MRLHFVMLANTAKLTDHVTKTVKALPLLQIQDIAHSRTSNLKTVVLCIIQAQEFDVHGVEVYTIALETARGVIFLYIGFSANSSLPSLVDPLRNTNGPYSSQLRGTSHV